VLLAAVFGFLPADDERLRATVSPSPTTSPRTGTCSATAPTRRTTDCLARKGRS
jgi:hypothetical protein